MCVSSSPPSLAVGREQALDSHAMTDPYTVHGRRNRRGQILPRPPQDRQSPLSRLPLPSLKKKHPSDPYPCRTEEERTRVLCQLGRLQRQPQLVGARRERLDVSSLPLRASERSERVLSHDGHAPTAPTSSWPSTGRTNPRRKNSSATNRARRPTASSSPRTRK